MRRTAKIAFLGPVHGIKGASGRITAWGFSLVQAGSDPFRMEFTDLYEARNNRKSMKGTHTHAVNSWALFNAITASLAEQRMLDEQAMPVVDNVE